MIVEWYYNSVTNGTPGAYSTWVYPIALKHPLYATYCLGLLGSLSYRTVYNLTSIVDYVIPTSLNYFCKDDGNFMKLFPGFLMIIGF